MLDNVTHASQFYGLYSVSVVAVASIGVTTSLLPFLLLLELLLLLRYLHIVVLTQRANETGNTKWMNRRKMPEICFGVRHFFSSSLFWQTRHEWEGTEGGGSQSGLLLSE